MSERLYTVRFRRVSSEWSAGHSLLIDRIVATDDPSAVRRACQRLSEMGLVPSCFTAEEVTADPLIHDLEPVSCPAD